MPEDLVRYRMDNAVATITLDSLSNRNALSAAVRFQLIGHLGQAHVEPELRAVVINHTGPVFCSGLDLGEAADPHTAGDTAGELCQILETLWEFPVPVIASVGGPARAGGVGIMSACDIVIAAEKATFAFSEVRIGVVAAVIMVTVLESMLPRPAHELLLTGEVFDATRAVDAGLVNKAVPGADLDAEVSRYCDLFRLCGPGALTATKTLLRHPLSGDISARLQAASVMSAEHFASAEGQEGIGSFREKRPPAWVAAPR